MIVFFGVRSPLMPEFEETCRRLELPIQAGIRADGHPSRMIDKSKVVDLVDGRLPPGVTAPYLACATGIDRRRQLVAMAERAGLEPAPALIDPTAILASTVTCGRGVYIAPGSCMFSWCRVGDHVISWAVAIGHHTVIGDFTTVSPGATILSSVTVGRNVYIGGGVTVAPGVTIGDDAVLGTGSVVYKDVPPGHVTYGPEQRMRPIGDRRMFAYRDGQE